MSLTIKNKSEIISKLDEIYVRANANDFSLAESTKAIIIAFNQKIPIATSAYSNLITCLVSSACNKQVDPRYHRKPSDEMPPPPHGDYGWFSGRSISEQVIYPWMTSKGFRTAKSGWQTRTFERPRPYTLDYPENIAHIKSEFLSILDKVVNQQESADDILAYFFVLENRDKQSREILTAKLAEQNISTDILITDIIEALEEYFSLKRSARLPVIAVYAVYKLLLLDVKYYSSLSLEPLSAHEASDLRTGAIGDIELIDSDAVIAEAVEVKHRIQIDETILLRAEEKIKSSKATRYYILTTHTNCTLTDKKLDSKVKQIHVDNGCQVIVNGVLPTIQYYLRLVSTPKQFLTEYTELLLEDAAIKAFHLKSWDKIAKRFSL